MSLGTCAICGKELTAHAPGGTFGGHRVHGSCITWTQGASVELLDAVRYVLDRAQRDADLGFLIGPGTETFNRLCDAEAAAVDRPVETVRRERGRDLQPEHARKQPAQKRLRDLLSAARRRIAMDHHDGCPALRSSGRECECGHDDLVEACAEASP